MRFVTVGVALAGLILTRSRGLRQDMRQLREDMARLESQISELRERMAHEIGELRERMAKLEGLREAISGRAKAS